MPVPGMSARKMLATNVFKKSEGRWYMVHHHASPLLPNDRGAGGDVGSLAELLSSLKAQKLGGGSSS